MNQPQQLNAACDFQGFLVCQIPKDMVEVKLKIKTKWGKFHLAQGPAPQERKVQALEQSQ